MSLKQKRDGLMINDEKQVYLEPSLRALGMAESVKELYNRKQSVDYVRMNAIKVLEKNLMDIAMGINAISKTKKGSKERRELRRKVKDLIKLARERQANLGNNIAADRILRLEQEFHKEEYL